MDQYIPDEAALKVFSRPIALKYRAIPLKIVDRQMLMLFDNSPSANDLSDLIYYINMGIAIELTSPDVLDELITRHFPELSGSEVSSDDASLYEHRSGSANSEIGQGKIVDSVNALISRAATMKASDIHLEPTDTELGVRYRVDGVLQNMRAFSRDDQAAVISRIKLMAGMDIAEKRRPQDGRITMRSFDDLLDIRVSSVPARNSEKLVLRLLNKSESLKDLSHLGMTDSDLAVFKKYLDKPQGMILVSGPTGSGKSTTLYAALSYLARPGVNIMTIEDPIEYEVSGITQSQVKPEINYDFATALRAFLRQDPDIIMVGEVRDLETAQIALRAAMTGHLVLSTVHTNDAASTITRLIDIGIEPYLVASSISLVIAQRLLRTYCSSCRGAGITDRIASDSNQRLAIHNSNPTKGDKCEACNASGYRGRIGVFEVLEICDEVRKAIQTRCPAHVIESISREKGIRSLSDAATGLIAENRTSREEIRRVLSQ